MQVPKRQPLAHNGSERGILTKRYQAEGKETRRRVEAGGAMRLWGLGGFFMTKCKKNHQAGPVGKGVHRDRGRCKEPSWRVKQVPSLFIRALDLQPRWSHFGDFRPGSLVIECGRGISGGQAIFTWPCSWLSPGLRAPLSPPVPAPSCSLLSWPFSSLSPSPLSSPSCLLYCRDTKAPGHNKKDSCSHLRDTYLGQDS